MKRLHWLLFIALGICLGAGVFSLALLLIPVGSPPPVRDPDSPLVSPSPQPTSPESPKPAPVAPSPNAATPRPPIVVTQQWKQRLGIDMDNSNVCVSSRVAYTSDEPGLDCKSPAATFKINQSNIGVLHVVAWVNEDPVIKALFASGIDETAAREAARQLCAGKSVCETVAQITVEQQRTSVTNRASGWRVVQDAKAKREEIKRLEEERKRRRAERDREPSVDSRPDPSVPRVAEPEPAAPPEEIPTPAPAVEPSVAPTVPRDASCKDRFISAQKELFAEIANIVRRGETLERQIRRARIEERWDDLANLQDRYQDLKKEARRVDRRLRSLNPSTCGESTAPAEEPVQDRE